MMTARSLDIGKALSTKVPLREELGIRTEICDRHGVFDSNGVRILITKPPREIWSGCPACKADSERAEAEAKDAQHQAALKARIEASLAQTAIPQRFIGKTLDNYRAETDGQRKALELCRCFAENFDRHLKLGTSLIMSGMPGTGKSHLAGAVLQALLPRHVGVYVTLMDLIRMLRDTWRKDSDTTESQLLTRLQDVPLLVIDEIGVQYGTDGERAILFDVLDRRYRAMRPVILMTNLGKDDFRAAIGDRVFDRLTEVARWIAFDWPSYRAVARKEMRDAA
jgi:DNA replication protein DnaC